MDRFNYFESDGIDIYLGPKLKTTKDTINIWIEEDSSHESIKIDGIRPHLL